jgi:3-methylcrotonyl-CoA carboxylase alpha subunit
VIRDGEQIHVRDRSGANCFSEESRFPAAEVEAAIGGCVAPMPGRVVQVLVVAEQAVEAGAPLVILEAMKMEQTLTTALPGTVRAIHCAPDDIVDAGAVLVEVDADDEADA